MTSKLSLDSLSFGSLDAEHDQGLLTYFYRTEVYDRTVSAETRFVLGPKGSGKSALFSYITKRGTLEEVFADTPIVPIQYPDLPLYTDHLARLLGTAPTVTTVWQFAFASLASAHIVQIFNAVGVETLIRFLHDWVAEQTDLWRSLSELLRVEVGPLRMSAGQRVTRQVRPIEIMQALEICDRLLQEGGKELLFFLDKLDEIPDGSVRGTTLAEILHGLMVTQSEMSRFPAIGFRIFLRDDIYDKLHYVNKDHFSASTVRIAWEKEDLLILLAARVRASFQETVDIPTIEEALRLVAQVFEKPGDVEFADWLVSNLSDGRGVTSPRDVLNFAIKAKQRQSVLNRRSGVTPGQPLISCGAMDYAMDGTSRDKLNDYLYGVFPGTEGFVSRLLGEDQAVFELDELQKLFGIEKRADLLVEVTRLIDAGALGTVDDLPLAKASAVAVGRIYRRALNLPV